LYAARDHPDVDARVAVAVDGGRRLGEQLVEQFDVLLEAGELLAGR
jgi:hypothetical protein